MTTLEPDTRFYGVSVVGRGITNQTMDFGLRTWFPGTCRTACHGVLPWFMEGTGLSAEVLAGLSEAVRPYGMSIKSSAVFVAESHVLGVVNVEVKVEFCVGSLEDPVLAVEGSVVAPTTVQPGSVTDPLAITPFPGLRILPQERFQMAVTQTMPGVYQGLRILPQERFQMRGDGWLRVYFLDHYFPRRFVESRSHDSSLNVIRLKDGDLGAAKYFAHMLIPRLPPYFVHPTIIAVPGHGRGSANPTGGLRQIIARIGATDLSDCLARITEIPKSAGAAPGTRVNFLEQVKTMALQQSEQLAGNHVILLDDVITRGDTMRAARYTLVHNATPASVTCLALTRTRFGSGVQFLRF